jgi:hypothetical protein
MSENSEKLFITWQGKVSGPFTLAELRNQLKNRQINSLYKVQTERGWVTLREFLADGDRKVAVTAVVAAATPPAARERVYEAQWNAPPPPPPAPAPTEELHASAGPEDRPFDEGRHENGASGMATAAFILSLFFFVPFLNLVCWVMSLIFGHLALSKMGSRAAKGRTLAWFGVFLSYITAGFLLVSLLLILAMVDRLSPEIFYALHGQLLGAAIGSLILMGLLMLSVNLLTGDIPEFATAYLASLLPSVVTLVAAFVLRGLGGFAEISSKDPAVGILLIAVVFIAQMVTWAEMIVLKDGRRLGYSHGAIASLFCTIVQTILTVVFVIFLAKIL